MRGAYSCPRGGGRARHAHIWSAAFQPFFEGLESPGEDVRAKDGGQHHEVALERAFTGA